MSRKIPPEIPISRLEKIQQQNKNDDDDEIDEELKDENELYDDDATCLVIRDEMPISSLKIPDELQKQIGGTLVSIRNKFAGALVCETTKTNSKYTSSSKERTMKNERKEDMEDDEEEENDDEEEEPFPAPTGWNRANEFLESSKNSNSGEENENHAPSCGIVRFGILLGIVKQDYGWVKWFNRNTDGKMTTSLGRYRVGGKENIFELQYAML
jgi:hypothetical protein